MLNDGSVNPGFVGDITCQDGQKRDNVPPGISTTELTNKTKVYDKKQNVIKKKVTNIKQQNCLRKKN